MDAGESPEWTGAPTPFLRSGSRSAVNLGALMATPRPIVRVLAVISLVTVWATPAESQALRYVDESGVAHWVSSREQIPLQYRNKVEQLDLPPVNSAPPSREQAQEERRRSNSEQKVEPQAEKPEPPAAPWAR